MKATADAVLTDVLRSGQVQHPNGSPIRVVANISAENADALRRLVETRTPGLVVEIGMAYGVSTLAILSGLQSNRHGRLISIDPYIGWPTGRIVALNQVARAGATHMHEHRHSYSFAVLPEMLKEGLRPDLIYIDGNHSFDFVFTDFFYADKLLDVGGLLGFNDCGWRSVYKVLGFLKKSRRFREVDVGLPRVYRGRNLLFSLIKRLEGRSSLDRYFVKVDHWKP